MPAEYFHFYKIIELFDKKWIRGEKWQEKRVACNKIVAAKNGVINATVLHPKLLGQDHIS